jgi:hypothetical protein
MDLMTAEATTEAFWTAFRALSKKERAVIMERLLADSEFREDLIDLAILKQRAKEPSRSIEEYLAQRLRKSR